MSGTPGNKNAKKKDDEKAATHLHVRCKKHDKKEWELAAKRVQPHGIPLSQWVIENLNSRS